MNNNDILRQLRYVFDFDDKKMRELFAKGDYDLTRQEVINFLKKEEDKEFQLMEDVQMATFLNGLIADKRGVREGVEVIAEKTLNNNIILRKLKIALNLKDIDMLNILDLVDLRISKHELSAFFRDPKQSQYRECKNQILRNFIHGMQLKYRDKVEVKPRPKSGPTKKMKTLDFNKLGKR